ncbi:MAG: endonuclease, partial [Bdellovibrionales bacterium]|nr:endonuclease [Bdellovibrionales bacterium]
MLNTLYLLILIFPLLSFSQNTLVKNYREAKKKLPSVFEGLENTFYCACSYQIRNIDIKSCGLETKSHSKRLNKMEWEHVVPASRFGRNFKEWVEGDEKCIKKKKLPNTRARAAALGDGSRFYLPWIKSYKGRKCARKVSKEFNKMEADLHNLRPSVGSINASRGNLKFSEGLHIFVPQFGECDLKIIDGKVEPSNLIKGDVARIYLYMEDAYPTKVILNESERSLFKKWSELDPV